MSYYDYQPFYDLMFKRVPKPISLRCRKDGKFFLAVGACKGDMVSLNAIAGEICMYCDGKRNVGEICEIMQKKYSDVEKYKLLSYICTCIMDLDNCGLIMIQDVN